MKIRSPSAIVSLLSLLNLVNYFDRTILAAVGPRVSEALGLSDTQFGFVGNAFMVGYLLTSPIFGALGDKRARKGLIALGIVIWSAATAASGLMATFATLVVARFVVGVGEASYATLAPTIIDDLVAPSAKNRSFAIFYVAIPVGSALGYVVGGHLEHAFGWRSAFFLAAGPAMVLSLLVMFIAEPAQKKSAVSARSGIPYAELFRIPLYRNAVLGYTAQTFAVGGLALWAPKYLYQQLGMDLSTADFWFGAVLVVTGLLATFLGGYLGDRWPGEDRVRASLRLCAWASLVSVPFAFLCLLQATPTGFFVCIGLAEFALFTSTSPINVVVLQSVPLELRASAMALSIATIHLLGDVISPPLVGLVSDQASLRAGMFMLPAAMAVSTWFWWRGSAQVQIAPAVSPPGRA